MFGHIPELAIILVIALVVFGPERLPEAAASAGKMVRELREAMDVAMNPEDHEVQEDFSTYYYESLERSGEDVPEEGFDDSEHDFAGGLHPEGFESEFPEADAGARPVREP